MRALKQGRVHEAAGVSENKRVSDWHAKASCPPADVGMGMRGAKPDHSRTLREADSQAACPTLAEQVTPHSFNCQTPAVCAQSTQSRSRKPAEPPTSLTHSLSLSLSLALLLSPRMKAFLSCELSLSLSRVVLHRCPRAVAIRPVPIQCRRMLLRLFFFFSFSFHSLFIPSTPTFNASPWRRPLQCQYHGTGEKARGFMRCSGLSTRSTRADHSDRLSPSLSLLFFWGSAISTH